MLTDLISSGGSNSGHSGIHVLFPTILDNIIVFPLNFII